MEHIKNKDNNESFFDILDKPTKGFLNLLCILSFLKSSKRYKTDIDLTEEGNDFGQNGIRVQN